MRRAILAEVAYQAVRESPEWVALRTKSVEGSTSVAKTMGSHERFERAVKRYRSVT